MYYISHSDKETRSIGGQIADTLTGGEILLLSGELGAGKTTLIKGLAKKLHVASEVTSPTFGLMQTYPIKISGSQIKNLVHVDTYRLKDSEELHDIGLEEFLSQPDTVCLIEWPEKAQKIINDKKTIKIHISTPSGSGNERKIEIGE